MLRAPVQIDQLLTLANLAGEVIMRGFTPFGMAREVKDDGTPLTSADTEISDLVLRRLRAISSEIDIITEEGVDRVVGSPWQIRCDPLDGTFPYSWGMPLATCMIAVLFENQPVMGVIHDPFLKRTYFAEKGQGAWMNDRRLWVSKTARPVIGYASWPSSRYNILRACAYLEQAGMMGVNFCCSGYIMAAVATGEFAATLFPGGKHHDTAAGHIIIEEAGGKVTDVFGQPIDYSQSTIKGHIASNGGPIHEQIVYAVRCAQ